MSKVAQLIVEVVSKKKERKKEKPYKRPYCPRQRKCPDAANVNMAVEEAQQIGGGARENTLRVNEAGRQAAENSIWLFKGLENPCLLFMKRVVNHGS